PGLIVRQMDAGAAFSRIRDEYQERIDGLFNALVSRGIDMQQDRAILRDLLALAPPGIDELFALSLLGDALAEQRFTRIVVDAARGRGVDLVAIVWNRVTTAPSPLPAAVAARQFFAEETRPAPVGVHAIRRWSASWRELTVQF